MSYLYNYVIYNMLLRGYKTSFESRAEFLKSFNKVSTRDGRKDMNKKWNMLPHMVPQILYSNSMLADLLHILNGVCKNMLECVRSVRTNYDFLVGNNNIDD